MGLGGSESAPPCDDLPEIAALLEELAAVADFGARTATLWDARDGRKLRVFPGGNDREEEHSDDVMSAAFSPAGRQVATASTDGYCRIWDAATGAQVKAIPHDIAVRSAEFNPQGDLLLTAAADGMARLWTLPDYQLRTQLKGHTETLPDARFSNDGDYIITASRDGTVRIYHSKPWWVYSLATQRVTRNSPLKSGINTGSPAN